MSLTLADAAALLGDDDVRDQAEAAYDRYDAAEAAEWAQFPYPRPLADRCERCGYREDAAGHRNACQERP